MAPDERPKQGESSLGPRHAEAGAARANPIRMALAELQGELTLPEAAGIPIEPPPSYAGSSGEGARAPRRPEARASAASAPPSFDEPGGPLGRGDAEGRGLVEARASGSRPGPSLPATLAASAFASLVFGAIGAWAYQQLSGEPVPTVAVAPTTEGGQAKDAPGTSSPAAPAAVDLGPLKSRIDDLSQRFERLKGQLDERPAASASHDTSTLARRVDALAEAIAPLSKGVENVAARVEALEKAPKGPRNETAPGRAGPENAPAVAATEPAPAAPPDDDRREPSRPIVEDINAADDLMLQGAELYKKGRHREAYDIFSRLEKTSPDDARVWYYAALSNGFATGQWNGETLRLVMKGVERERAGTPSAAEIDAAFRALNEGGTRNDNGKRWLEFYRAQAKPR